MREKMFVERQIKVGGGGGGGGKTGKEAEDRLAWRWGRGRDGRRDGR